MKENDKCSIKELRWILGALISLRDQCPFKTFKEIIRDFKSREIPVSKDYEEERKAFVHSIDETLKSMIKNNKLEQD